MDDADAATVTRCYVVETLLDPFTCERIRAAMDRGVGEAAEILGELQIELDAEVRRARSIEVDDATLGFVEALLDAQRHAIADFFMIRLARREGPSFLRYPPGGFYRRHQDRGIVAGWPAAADRQVAVVLFLNSSRAADAAGTFAGGSLCLFADDDAGKTVEIAPSAGLLVAFAADVPHEVTPVEGGTRDTIVDWFY